MREIKFRAIEFATDEWVIGSLTPQDSEISLAIFFANISTGRFDIKTLEQYTGLHDKNGKEYCDGDIVRCFEQWIDKDSHKVVEQHERNLQVQNVNYQWKFINHHRNDNGVLMPVAPILLFASYGEGYSWGSGIQEWDEYSSCLTRYTNFEIIGNIHENPELLEEG